MQRSDGFSWAQAAAGRALVCDALAPLARHLFTTRDWTLGSANGNADTLTAGWAQVAAALDADAAHLVRAHQVHGNTVIVRRAGEPAAGPPTDADVIVSNDPDTVIAIQTADCVPLLLGDRRTGAVGAAHAGWRGLAARVPSVAIAAMRDAFNSAPSDLVVAIGPAISADRYEVGRDVLARFEAAGFDPASINRWFVAGARSEHWLFDGWQCARDQLLDAGVAADAIHLSAQCTASQPDLFCSYRRDGKGAGRMAAAIRART